MKLLLTGTSGMVGRNLLEYLEQKSDYDLLAPKRKELDLLDKAAVEHYIKQNKPDAIVHMAAIVGGIQANINQPVKFLVENSYINLNVINAAQISGVRNLLYLGSSCMYPKDRELLPETTLLDGKLEPTNEAYALAKITGGMLCEYISRQYKLNYKTIVPPNLYGKYDNFDPISSHMIPGVIRKLHEAKVKGLTEVGIWGDGSARREFMFVSDLVEFIHFALANIDTLPPMVNVGMGTDYTINEYYQAIADVVGYNGDFSHQLDKPVGMMRKLLDSQQALKMGWKAKTELHDGLQQAYEYFLTLES